MTLGSNEIPAIPIPGDGSEPEIGHALGLPFEWDRQIGGLGGEASARTFAKALVQHIEAGNR